LVVLPFCYGGSNGLITQDTNDAALFRGFGTSRLARTVCAAPTGAANMALYGKMAGIVYQDYIHARLIVLWGVNPAASGIHLVPYLKEAREAGAKIVVLDPRATSLARQADLHIQLKPGTDLSVALSIHRYLFEDGHADRQFLAEHTRARSAARAGAEWTFERAAEVAGVDAGARAVRGCRRDVAALVRCGWGLERNRNGGSAATAVWRCRRWPESSRFAAAGFP
jgi:anaerobic selenocysteine-containing dehydrogenase